MTITRPTYATIESVRRALDVKWSANQDDQIGRALEAAADSMDGGTGRIGGLLKRRFYPETDTRYFDWPGESRSRPWRLWLDANELISVTTLTAGGTTIAAADYNLEPNTGPPYNRVEIDLSSSAAFSSGNTHQRAIAITGLWGYAADTVTAGALAEALDASETGVDVTDSSAIGAGDLIKVDSEYLLVTARTMLDTGVNIDAGDSLTAAKNDVSLTVSSSSGAPVAGETILIDSERMLVTDVAGTVLTVVRAYDGTVLAAHSANADIYAPRTLTVTRGAVGSTAATHTTSTAVSRHVSPGLLRSLVVAEAITIGQQDNAGWARTAGSGDNEREVGGRGVASLRAQAVESLGRKARHRAV